MKHCPHLESVICMADKKIQDTQEFQYSQPLDPILNHLNPFDTLMSYLSTVIKYCLK